MRQVRAALAASVAIWALGASMPVLAQDRPASGQSPDENSASAQEDIVVTGSRIANSGVTAPTPTTVVGAEEIANKGATNILAVLNDLPSFRSTQSPTILTQSAYPGASFVDLRGLGVTRTLTLVDGRRFVATNVTGQFDVNILPTSLIERVEVVTGGASAAWGSDAVAGVANVILRKNIEGLEGSIQGGVSGRGDNKSFGASLVYGAGFGGGRGHVTIAGEYSRSGEVRFQGDRPWGRNDAATIANPQYAPGNGQPAFIVVDNVKNIQGAPGGLIVAANGGLLPTTSPLRGIQFGSDSSMQPFNYGAIASDQINAVGGSGISLAPFNPIATPSRRYTAFLDARYDLTDKVQLFAQLSYADVLAFDGHGNVPQDLGGNAIRILPDNGYTNTLPQLAALSGQAFRIGRINVDFGVPDISVRVKVKRGVVGLKGELGGDWNWSAYYERGRTDYLQTINNARIGANAPFTPGLTTAQGSDLNNHWGQAIDTIVLNGQVVCRNPDARAQGCQPLNPFGNGAYSAAARAYVTGKQVQNQTLDQDAADINISGTLFNNWAGPVTAAFGADYRRDSVVATVDPLAQASAYWFGNPKAFRGSLNVKELFAEANFPLLADVPGFKRLDLNGAFRHLDYSTSGGVNTWKVGAVWEPIDGLRLRGTRSRDIRAPNINELFSTTTQRNQTVNDPLNGNQAVFPPALFGGNPNLKPEKALPTTVGVTVQPSFLRNFHASVDYYTIKISDAITNPDPQQLVNVCASGSSLCNGEVVRSATNSIQSILLVLKNVALIKTSGVDFELGYRTRIGAGALDTRLLGTYVMDQIANLNGTPIDYAGQIVAPPGAAAQFTVPHLTWSATVSYSQDEFSLGGTVRFLSASNINNRATPTNIVEDNRLPAAAYLNLFGTFNIAASGLKKFQFFWAVDNVFDKFPPHYATGGQQVNYGNPVWYDPIGTTFRAGLRFAL